MFTNLSSLLKIGETGILLILAVLSVSSLAIIIERFLFLRQYARASDFQTVLSNLHKTASTHLANEAISTLEAHSKNIDQLQLAYRGFVVSERLRLEKGLNFLATLGSNAPFIGLLGTVIGIIEAFAALSTSQSGSQAVMAGISQALFATAVGLFVAIPAVIAFNVFSNHIRKAFFQCERIRDAYTIRRFYS